MSDTQISNDAPAWPWMPEEPAGDPAPGPQPETESRLVDQGAQEPPDGPNAETGTAQARPKRSAPLWIVAVVAALIGASVSGGIVGATRGAKTKLVNGATPVAASTSASSSNSSSAPPVAGGSQVRDVLAKVEPAVVTITTNSGAGTGMIISADGEILTNAHVVGRSTTVKVTLFKETSSRTADVIGVGNANTGPDVALVKIRNASNLPTVTLGDSDKINVGDDVIAIGNALDLAGSPTVTKGIVSATDRSLPDAGTSDTYVQTDAAINPGNSGGPLVTGDGTVIGMNTLVIQDAGNNEAAQNLGFAIAVNEIKPLISNLEKGGQLTTGNGAYLGVASETVTSD